RHPEVKWAEREDKVYLTVMLPDAKNPKVNLAPEGTFTFSATGGAGDNAYELTLDLFDKVDVEVRETLILVEWTSRDDDEAEVSKPEDGAEREGDEKLEGAAAAEKTEASSA
uniref:Co-chaperone protein p23 n=1 Tax=Chenopodium quinoa TaxID=63459 RepID=A0A803L9W4_CHEQI